MAYQQIFRRYEMKFLLTRAQKERLLQTMEPYMALDQYGRTTIRNVYFDTDDYRLIRRSLEKPVYKEKLRLRSYRLATPQSRVFVELKKKYNGVVYKRRLALAEEEAVCWLLGHKQVPDNQIGREVEYFLSYYGPVCPAVFLSYEREAYYCRQGGDFRLTLDENILARQEEISLEAPVWGTPLLEADKTLMEVKTSGGIPLWLTAFLTREGIYKTSFSKYGTAYQTMIYPKWKGTKQYA